jgi:hypothetical protein
LFKFDGGRLLHLDCENGFSFAGHRFSFIPLISDLEILLAAFSVDVLFALSILPLQHRLRNVGVQASWPYYAVLVIDLLWELVIER